MTGRLGDVFHVLKVVRRTLDETHEANDAAMRDTSEARPIVDQLLVAGSTAQLHAICVVVISEREMLAKALDNIRGALDAVDITPRTRNLGKGARSQRPQ
jgi:hypothetical protein